MHSINEIEVQTMPVEKYQEYAAFTKAFPLLGNRLHTLHCESCKPMGMALSIAYEGDTLNGQGRVFVTLQYSKTSFGVTVKNGVIYAFGRVQSMRRPTRMRLSTGFSDYGETDDLLLK